MSKTQYLSVDKILKSDNIRITKQHHALPEVVKLVDAVDSKSTVRENVSVRVRPSGPLILHRILDKPRNLDIQRFRGFVVSGVCVFLRYFSGLFGIYFRSISALFLKVLIGVYESINLSA